MLIKWVIVSILVFASVASSAQRDGRDNRDRHDRVKYYQINRPTHPVRPAPPVRTAPAVQAPSQVIPRHSTIMTPTSPNVTPPAPVVTTTPTVVESPVRSKMDRREVRSRVPVVESSRSDGRRYSRDSDRRVHHSRPFHGTTVFTPYYPYYPYYPYDNYYTSTRVYNPNRLFICYQEDQIEEERYHITCPHPISWYSTYPEYDTVEYRTRYRPEYVCPTYGASYFLEFDSSYEATTWWNNYCNTWQSSF